MDKNGEWNVEKSGNLQCLWQRDILRWGTKSETE